MPTRQGVSSPQNPRSGHVWADKITRAREWQRDGKAYEHPGQTHDQHLWDEEISRQSAALGGCGQDPQGASNPLSGVGWRGCRPGQSPPGPCVPLWGHGRGCLAQRGQEGTKGPHKAVQPCARPLQGGTCGYADSGLARWFSSHVRAKDKAVQPEPPTAAPHLLAGGQHISAPVVQQRGSNTQRGVLPPWSRAHLRAYIWCAPVKVHTCNDSFTYMYVCAAVKPHICMYVQLSELLQMSRPHERRSGGVDSVSSPSPPICPYVGRMSGSMTRGC